MLTPLARKDRKPRRLVEQPDRTATGSLYDGHGTALFRLAHAMTGDVDAAERAVVEAFRRACGSRRTGPARSVGQELTRFIVEACLKESSVASTRRPGTDESSSADLVESQGRVLVGLTMHHQYTYRDAAALLEMDAAVAADLLRTALRRARPIQSTCPEADAR